jgi:hypothetical protein
MKFKLNDRVKNYSYGVGEVITIDEDNQIVVAFNEYDSALTPCDEVDFCELSIYDDRFYGEFEEGELELYSIDEELKDIEEQISALHERRSELLKERFYSNK